jgi:TfoX/Sxy family transcriptional regulator of competence genes
MQMPKPTDADKAHFKSLVPDDVHVEVKPMFGNLGAFINGNMFMGLFGSDVGIKLDEPDQRRLAEAGGGPFGPKERPMGGYITLPAAFSIAEAKPWIAKSLDYIGARPPKQAKPARKA